MRTNESAPTDDVFITGLKTISDWKAFQSKLVPGGDSNLWEEALTDYFESRLFSRYLSPIKKLQESGSWSGEGFSIVVIQCSLIEFLESTVQGITYRYVPQGKDTQPLEEYEYSSSSAIFRSFLVNRPPFKECFTEPTANSFYGGVRCGLLHEARTKNGWRIKAQAPNNQPIDAEQKIVYRNNFQEALEGFVEWYKSKLPFDCALQKAFIRKFDGLCK